MALTAVGQGLYVAAAPLLGRLYSPEEFGLYGLFYLFITTSTMFVCLNYDMAVPAAVSEVDAEDLTEASIRISLVLCGLIAAILTAFIVLNFMGFGSLPVWAGPLAFVILLLQALIQVFQAWYVRRQTAVTIGRAGITLNAARSGSQVALGVFSGPWWGLGLGEVIGRAASLVHSIVAPGAWHPRSGFFSAPMPWHTLKRYRQFPLVLLGSTAIDAMVLFAQIAVLSALFGAVGMGQYFMMRRTLDLPIAFAFRSLSDVFYGRLAAHSRETPERVKPFYVRSVFILAAVGFVCAVPLMFFAKPLFELILGPAWGEAGVLAAVMAPSAVLNLAVAPASRIFGLSHRPWLRYAYTAANAVSSGIALLLAATNQWSLFATTCGLSAAISFSYVVYFIAGAAAAERLIVADGAPEDPPQLPVPPARERSGP